MLNKGNIALFHSSNGISPIIYTDSSEFRRGRDFQFQQELKIEKIILFLFINIVIKYHVVQKYYNTFNISTS